MGQELLKPLPVSCLLTWPSSISMGQVNIPKPLLTPSTWGSCQLPSLSTISIFFYNRLKNLWNNGIDFCSRSRVLWSHLFYTDNSLVQNQVSSTIFLFVLFLFCNIFNLTLRFQLIASPGMASPRGYNKTLPLFAIYLLSMVLLLSSQSALQPSGLRDYYIFGAMHTWKFTIS